MISWMIEHWTSLVGGGGIASVIAAAVRYLPRMFVRIAVIANCEWHRAQGLARETALEMEIDRLEEALNRDLAPHGGNDSSVSATTRTTRTTTRSSRD